MKRLSSILAVGMLVATVAACSGSTGGLGSVPTAAPIPSDEPGGPDLTPGPSSPASPSAEPSESPGATPSNRPSAAPGGSAAPTPAPSGTTIVRAYFVLGGEPGTVGLVPVLREVPKTTAVARAAMTALLAGPTAAESGDRTMSSAIPDGTDLLGITIKNGIATVDLSTEFDSGGGSTSMQFRLAQVVYTLTQFSTVKSVVFQVEGETVTVFGGEGIVLDGPQARVDYYDQLPSIFVDRPAYGAALGNPGRVAGNANVFEATFRVALIGAGGQTLVDQQVMATCGTGCRGTFDVSLQYTVSKGQWGTLRTYFLSAKDGTPKDIRDYPVWLTPAS
jgi:Sporulation and spore germination/Immunoglobulin-like domain of bacterial spore germination